MHHDPAVTAETKHAALGRELAAALGDDYEVVRPLGAGGFAVVFLVRDLRLKRDLAVKVLAPDVVTPVVRERFRREAETVASLAHPNIVPLHFVGQHEQMVYLAMACIDGGSLADRLARETRLAVCDAVTLFGEVARALAFAHKRGVLHRDIKPENILLDTETGRALVTDFGIARSGDTASLTATGMLVGTPAYLAPEQVAGEAADHRADLFALGVVMYQALAGEAPFTGPTPTAVLLKRLAADPVPVETLRPDLPIALARLVQRCLARDPAERVQSAGEVVEALQAIDGSVPAATTGATTGATTAPRPLPPSGARGRRAMALGALVLAAAGGAAVFGLPDRSAARSSASPSPAARVAPAPKAAALPADSALIVIPAGSYPFGTNDGPADTRPLRTVTLAAFFIERREVSVGAYRRFVATGRAAPPWSGAPPADDLPVTGVVFAEAAAYCAWRYPAGGRLPTESEWEAAARGRSGRRYAWGEQWIDGAANAARADGRSAPVGSPPAGRTPEGVEDLIGNVWEWTSSPYTMPGQGAEAGMYVIRGGAHNASRDVATGYYRGRARLTAPRGDLALTGIRCAVSAP